ncbi:hypothetical protein Cyrtocomes_01047 [Candidatus Cyrtobacter comes]|uniref:Uncharacterized protein n=1 Tax=Candidatus Cyrtobacter comes TaxID=675776 RepID=A0ABU5L960_9RICK|nr:hypothetical protein [Candidatus Cyrtobacter comes]MDZ5762656.1 hypothetical protein [Candidatus Cyrtobacter comes]
MAILGKKQKDSIFTSGGRITITDSDKNVLYDKGSSSTNGGGSSSTGGYNWYRADEGYSDTRQRNPSDYGDYYYNYQSSSTPGAAKNDHRDSSKDGNNSNNKQESSDSEIIIKLKSIFENTIIYTITHKFEIKQHTITTYYQELSNDNKIYLKLEYISNFLKENNSTVGIYKQGNFIKFDYKQRNKIALKISADKEHPANYSKNTYSKIHALFNVCVDDIEFNDFRSCNKGVNCEEKNKDSKLKNVRDNNYYHTDWNKMKDSEIKFEYSDTLDKEFHVAITKKFKELKINHCEAKKYIFDYCDIKDNHHNEFCDMELQSLFFHHVTDGNCHINDYM